MAPVPGIDDASTTEVGQQDAPRRNFERRDRPERLPRAPAADCSRFCQAPARGSPFDRGHHLFASHHVAGTGDPRSRPIRRRISTKSDLSELEDEVAAMPDDPGADLDQLLAQGRQPRLTHEVSSLRAAIKQEAVIYQRARSLGLLYNPKCTDLGSPPTFLHSRHPAR
jgi:hypothetical protein